MYVSINLLDGCVRYTMNKFSLFPVSCRKLVISFTLTLQTSTLPWNLMENAINWTTTRQTSASRFILHAQWREVLPQKPGILSQTTTNYVPRLRWKLPSTSEKQFLPLYSRQPMILKLSGKLRSTHSARGFMRPTRQNQSWSGNNGMWAIF